MDFFDVPNSVLKTKVQCINRSFPFPSESRLIWDKWKIGGGALGAVVRNFFRNAREKELQQLLDVFTKKTVAFFKSHFLPAQNNLGFGRNGTTAQREKVYNDLFAW